MAARRIWVWMGARERPAGAMGRGRMRVLRSRYRRRLMRLMGRVVCLMRCRGSIGCKLTLKVTVEYRPLPDLGGGFCFIETPNAQVYANGNGDWECEIIGELRDFCSRHVPA